MIHIYDKLESLCRACRECSRDRDPPAHPPPARVKLDMIKNKCKIMYYDHGRNPMAGIQSPGGSSGWVGCFL